MAKTVLRWPLKLDPSGKLMTDSAYTTGIRMITHITKRARLGNPGQGISAALIEQIDTRLTEDRMLLLTTLLTDIAAFLPSAAVHSIQFVPSLDNRKVGVNVFYVPADTNSKKHSFTWFIDK